MGLTRVHRELKELIDKIQEEKNVNISKVEASRIIAQKARTQMMKEKKDDFKNLSKEDII